MFILAGSRFAAPAQKHGGLLGCRAATYVYTIVLRLGNGGRLRNGLCEKHGLAVWPLAGPRAAAATAVAAVLRAAVARVQSCGVCGHTRSPKTNHR